MFRDATLQYRSGLQPLLPGYAVSCIKKLPAGSIFFQHRIMCYYLRGI